MTAKLGGAGRRRGLVNNVVYVHRQNRKYDTQQRTRRQQEERLWQPGRDGGHKTEQDEAAAAAAATATRTALRCGQVQSSLMSPCPMPHATCHNCNVLHAMLPLWCRLCWSSTYCLRLSSSLSLSLSFSLRNQCAHDTHLAAVLLPMTETETSRAR